LRLSPLTRRFVRFRRTRLLLVLLSRGDDGESSTRVVFILFRRDDGASRVPSEHAYHTSSGIEKVMRVRRDE